MATPPEYVPGLVRAGGVLRLTDYSPTQAITYGASAGGSAPGRPWNQPSRPLTAQELRQTFGGVGTVIMAGIIRPDGAGPPELEGERAIATYERMYDSDGQCAALMHVYLLPLLQATYSIQAASDDPEDVTIAQETSDNLLHGMTGQTWHRFLRQLYLFRGVYGHAVFEKCWTVQGGAIRLRKLAPRLPKTIWRWYPNADDELDRIQQRVWVIADDGLTGAYEYPFIPAAKLLLSVRNQVGNNFLGTSLYRACYKHWYYKDQLYAIDGIAAAKNAMGVPTISETEPNPDVVRQQSDRQLATNALAAYQANERAYFYLPHGYQFDLKAVSGQVRQIMPSIEHHDLLIARSFLAQFINVDSGGTLIAARDASSFFLEALMGEAVEVADDMNPLIRELEEYNHGGRDRYSTLQMQDLEQRDLDEYLKGIAGLITAGGIDPDDEFKAWIRDYIDAPAPAAARGDGTGGVDPDSQGQAVEGAGDAQKRRAAAGMDDGDVADAGGDTDEPTELRRQSPARLATAERGAQARALVQRAATHSLRRRQGREGLVTVPRVHGEPLVLTRRGGRWESYTREPSVWSGWSPEAERVDLGVRDVIRRIGGAVGGAIGAYRRAVVGETPKTLIHRELGDGGASGKHCPQCVAPAEGGPYTAQTPPTHPGDGDTYCGSACTCSLRYEEP